MKTQTREEVVLVLKQRMELAGSLRKLAIELGVSSAYLSDVIAGKRRPGPKILTPLRLVRREVYENGR